MTTSTKISLINIEGFKVYSWSMDPHHILDFLECHATLLGDVQKARKFLYLGFMPRGCQSNPDPVCYRFKGATLAYSSGSFH